MNSNFGSISSFHETSIIPNINELSYIDNILKINKGKKVEISMSFNSLKTTNEESFNGIIEGAGKDHIILSDPTSGNWYLLLISYINFIKFEENINILS